MAIFNSYVSHYQRISHSPWCVHAKQWNRENLCDWASTRVITNASKVLNKPGKKKLQEPGMAIFLPHFLYMKKSIHMDVLAGGFNVF